MIDLNDELAQDYLADCREHLAAIEADLLSLAMGGAPDNEDRLRRVYKGVHFIWGGSAFFDLVNIRELAYTMEKSLTFLRSQNGVITPKQGRSLISATDKLSELIRNPVLSNQANIQANLDDLNGQQIGRAHV